MTYPGCPSVQSLVILPSALQGGSLPILPSVCPCCRLIRSSFCINVFPSSCLFSSLFCPSDYPSASACSFTTPPVLFWLFVYPHFSPSVFPSLCHYVISFCSFVNQSLLLALSVYPPVLLSFRLSYVCPFLCQSASIRSSIHPFFFYYCHLFCQYLFPCLYSSISPSYCPFVDLFVLLSVRSHSRPYISSCVRPSGLTTRLLFCSFLPVSLSARPTVYSFLFASLIAISTVNLLLPSRSSNSSWLCPFILPHVHPSVCYLCSQRFEFKRALYVFKHGVSAIGHRFDFHVNRSGPIAHKANANY